MCSSDVKVENRKNVLTNSLILRNHLPSFLGLMLQMCNSFITNECHSISRLTEQMMISYLKSFFDLKVQF